MHIRLIWLLNILLVSGALAAGSEPKRYIRRHVHLTPEGIGSSEETASTLQRKEGRNDADALASLHAVGVVGTGMKGQYPFYHTGEEINAEARRLAAKCRGAATVRTVNRTGVSIDVVRVRAKGTKPSNRVFILFGEHSRELIGPESGLHLLRVLCGEASAGDSAISGADALKENEFELVLNGNPRSRAKVEAGEYCVRENPDGVDLNRNWDEMWQAGASTFSNTNPGPHPFSEPETQIFKELVTSFRPTTFLTVHSGTRGLYMPWAYDTEHLASRNQPSMLQILKRVDERHCQCPYGAAGKEVGYACPGTCLDWVYDQLKTPYAFAFEIYTSPDQDTSLQRRWQEKVQAGGATLLQEGHHLGHQHFLDLFQKHTSDFVLVSGSSSRPQRGRGAAAGMTNEECFGNFNPDTQERYDATVQNWVAAYLEMAHHVSQDMHRNSTGVQL